MALMRRGVTDLNTEDPALLKRASRRPQGAQRDRAREGHDHRLRDAARRAHVAEPGVVGRHAQRGHLLPARGHDRRRALATGTRRPAGRSSTTASASAPRREKPVMAHRFLNYMLDPKVALENFVGYVGYQPPITKIDARGAVRAASCCRENLRELRRHARGLRERQRVPGADRRRPPRVGPGLGRVPQRLMRARAGPSWRCRAWRGWPRSSSSRSTRSSPSGSATSPTLYEPVPHWNPLDWNVGYLLAGDRGRRCRAGARGACSCARCSTSSSRSRSSLAIGYPVAYYVSRHAHGRDEGGAAGPARRAVLDLVPDADVRLDEPAGDRRLRGATC